MRPLLRAVVKRLRAALDRVWAPLAQTKIGRFITDTLSALRAVVLGFRGESINVRAGNLTFITVFSLIPMLTVALALLQLLNQHQFQRRVTGFLRDILAPGIQAESAAFLERFITSASSKAAGGVSFLFLALSGSMLLRHLDASLNEIWEVRRRRPLLVSLLVYLLALTLGPLLLGAWLWGTALVRGAIQGADLPFGSQVLGLGALTIAVASFTAIYKLGPHAPVRFRSALAGGLVGGLGWELARHTYSQFALWGIRYNPIYGSLSAAPLFLMWLFVSWWLLLMGARLAYAVEHASAHGQFLELVDHSRSRELIAARVVQRVARAQVHQVTPPTAREIARSLNLPAQLVSDVAHQLMDAGLLVFGFKKRLSPARPLEQLTLAEVSTAVGAYPEPAPVRAGSEFQWIDSVFAEADARGRARLQHISWRELADSRIPEES